MAGGRPRRKDDEICQNCGRQGYSRPVDSWNSKSKPKTKYRYLRFVHADRNLPECYIDNLVRKKFPVRLATEFSRKTNEVTTFLYNPYASRTGDVITQWRTVSALPIAIYSLTWVSKELESTIKKLRKSKTLRLTEKEVKWLVQQDDYTYLKELSKDDIVTFGEDARKLADEINNGDLGSWGGKIRYFRDSAGMLARIQEIRQKNKMISTTHKNLGYKMINPHLPVS